MSYALATTLPYMLSDGLLYEFATPGMYMWSLIPSLFALIILLCLGKTKLEWKRDLILQPLCAFVAYMDLVGEMETYKTPIATIQPRTQSVWQGLIAIPVAFLISLCQRRKIVITLFEKDIAPLASITIGYVGILLVSIVQALVTNQMVTRTFVTDIVAILVKEQLQYRDISISLIVASTCFYRFLFAADWRCIHSDTSCIRGEKGDKAIEMGVLLVVMLYSLVYLCQKSIVYLPAMITIGSRMVLARRTASDTMMGLVVLIVSYFHWYFEDELAKTDEPISGQVVEVIVADDRMNDSRGYSSINADAEPKP